MAVGVYSQADHHLMAREVFSVDDQGDDVVVGERAVLEGLQGLPRALYVQEFLHIKAALT